MDISFFASEQARDTVEFAREFEEREGRTIEVKLDLETAVTLLDTLREARAEKGIYMGGNRDMALYELVDGVDRALGWASDYISKKLTKEDQKKLADGCMRRLKKRGRNSKKRAFLVPAISQEELDKALKEIFGR